MILPCIGIMSDDANYTKSTPIFIAIRVSPLHSWCAHVENIKTAAHCTQLNGCPKMCINIKEKAFSWQCLSVASNECNEIDWIV